MTWDVVIAGAGPAGLSAAQVLGRARRRVLVLDGGAPRNAATHAMHGVLGHDGRDPADVRAQGREELRRYGVEVVAGDVQEAGAVPGGFELAWGGGSARTRTVLLATGMLDDTPPIDGFDDVWGTSAHTCPYCDGWEHRDERLAVLGRGARPVHLATLLRQWSEDVVLLSDGPHGVADEELQTLGALGIPVVEDRIARLRSSAGRLEAVAFAGREPLARDALFFFVGWRPRTGLARRLGCSLRDDGSIVAGADGETTVDGVYAAGNCADPRALVPAAAGDAVRAAVAINVRLAAEDVAGALRRAEAAPA